MQDDLAYERILDAPTKNSKRVKSYPFCCISQSVTLHMQDDLAYKQILHAPTKNRS
jgi:hypothetical protein